VLNGGGDGGVGGGGGFEGGGMVALIGNVSPGLKKTKPKAVMCVLVASSQPTTPAEEHQEHKSSVYLCSIQPARRASRGASTAQELCLPWQHPSQPAGHACRGAPRAHHLCLTYQPAGHACRGIPKTHDLYLGSVQQADHACRGMLTFSVLTSQPMAVNAWRC
jgi:hypothetical protein